MKTGGWWLRASGLVSLLLPRTTFWLPFLHIDLRLHDEGDAASTQKKDSPKSAACPFLSSSAISLRVGKRPGRPGTAARDQDDGSA